LLVFLEGRLDLSVRSVTIEHITGPKGRAISDLLSLLISRLEGLRLCRDS
jgi:hypothetical protein